MQLYAADGKPHDLGTLQSLIAKVLVVADDNLFEQAPLHSIDLCIYSAHLDAHLRSGWAIQFHVRGGTWGHIACRAHMLLGACSLLCHPL